MEFFVAFVTLDFDYAIGLYGNDHLRQTEGVPQGSGLSPFCCCLLAAFFECRTPNIFFWSQSILYALCLRWIDDLYIFYVTYDNEASSNQATIAIETRLQISYGDYRLSVENPDIFVGLRVRTNSGLYTISPSSHNDFDPINCPIPRLQNYFSNLPPATLNATMVGQFADCLFKSNHINDLNICLQTRMREFFNQGFPPNPILNCLKRVIDLSDFPRVYQLFCVLKKLSLAK